jgi:hypothetical protein
MYKIYGDSDTFLYQTETEPTTMRDYEQYYITDADEKIINETYNENSGKLYVDDESKELKKLAPHEEKIDINHENYDYCYARCNADDGYVSIGDQQDMQYWDAVNGTTTWQDHIRSVKEKYPKT